MSWLTERDALEVTKKVSAGFMPAGTIIGTYTNGNGTFAALRPVYPGGSNVFQACLLRASAGTRPTEGSKRWPIQGSCQLQPPPGQAGRKTIRTRFYGTKNDPRKKHVNTLVGSF
jgi:hypothetical protein